MRVRVYAFAATVLTAGACGTLLVPDLQSAPPGNTRIIDFSEDPQGKVITFEEAEPFVSISSEPAVTNLGTRISDPVSPGGDLDADPLPAIEEDPATALQVDEDESAPLIDLDGPPPGQGQGETESAFDLILELREFAEIRRAAKSAGGDIRLVAMPANLSAEDLLLPLEGSPFFECHYSHASGTLTIKSRGDRSSLENLQSQVTTLEERRRRLRAEIGLLEEQRRRFSEVEGMIDIGTPGGGKEIFVHLQSDHLQSNPK